MFVNDGISTTQLLVVKLVHLWGIQGGYMVHRKQNKRV